MNRAWKRATEQAESSNFDPEVIAKDVSEGVARDFQELLPEEMKKRLKRMANENQAELSGNRSADLQELYRLAAGSPLAIVVVQNLEMTLTTTCFPSDAVEQALKTSYSIWGADRIRQIEEHYVRHPKGSIRAARKVRTGLESGAGRSDAAEAIATILGQKKRAVASKITGLDEFAP